MSDSSKLFSRRQLIKGAGAMWLLSVSQPGFAASSQVIAVRVWPASSYTRVTVESNRQIKYRQFALSNPSRVVVDLEGVNLNSVLKGVGNQIRTDDPFIQSARVGQFDPKTVRMVFELKQNVTPHLFALAPVAEFKERLVMDLYPVNSNSEQDPLLALLEDYNNGELDKKVPQPEPATPGHNPVKPGATGRLLSCSIPAMVGKIPALSVNIKPGKKTWCCKSPVVCARSSRESRI